MPLCKLLTFLSLIIALVACGAKSNSVKEEEQTLNIDKDLRRYREEAEVMKMRNDSFNLLKERIIVQKTNELISQQRQKVILGDSGAFARYEALIDEQASLVSLHNQILYEYLASLEKAESWFAETQKRKLPTDEIILRWDSYHSELEQTMSAEKTQVQNIYDWERRYLQWVNLYSTVPNKYPQ